MKANNYGIYAIKYTANLLAANPNLTLSKAMPILADAGIDSKTAHDIFALAKKLGNRSFSLKAKRFVKAYTKTERVLQDDYDPAFVSPDYNLVNDESVNDSIDFHDELTNDGEEDFDALEQDKRQLSNDGFVFI